MRHPALIFDFGNVIAFFDFTRATTRLGASCGISGQDLLDEVARSGGIALHHEYEHGRLTTPDFVRAWQELAQTEATSEEFATAWTSIFTPNASIVPILESLHRQGYTLILGSNTNALHAAHLRAAYHSILECFDALVLSCEIGHMKPSGEFYEACARAAGCPPSACLFIDDLAANVAGAQASTMNGLLYTTTPQLIADLNERGIDVSGSKNRSAVTPELQ